MAETTAGEEKPIRKDEVAEGEMKPWEQHSAVISIPRFDYKAPTSFLHHSFSGFLVTCPIKREKSGTKEVMSILEKYLGSIKSRGSETEEDSGNVVSKRRKVGAVGIAEECSNGKETEVDESTDADTEQPEALSLVKLTRSGLILLTFQCGRCPDVVDIVSDIMHSLESRSLNTPLWCHRIFPIQTTCVLREKQLCTLVSKLVTGFVNNEGKELARPMKFAVGYNRRGIEETELKGAKCDSKQVALLDRNKCFEVVAGAVKNIISDSVVDLKRPQLSVLIELLPISGVPKGSPVVAVSVLPEKLVATKPRLCIKALVPS